MAKKLARVRWGEFEYTDAEIERQIAAATARGEQELSHEPLATAVRFDPRTRCVVIELNKGQTFSAPVELLQGLSGAATRDLCRVEVVDPGVAIEWPTLDQQFSIRGLLSGVFGTKAWMAKLAPHPPASKKVRRVPERSPVRRLRST